MVPGLCRLMPMSGWCPMFSTRGVRQGWGAEEATFPRSHSALLPGEMWLVDQDGGVRVNHHHPLRPSLPGAPRSLRKEEGALGRGFTPGAWPQPTKACCGTCRPQACSVAPLPSIRRNESWGPSGPIAEGTAPLPPLEDPACDLLSLVRVGDILGCLLIFSLWHFPCILWRLVWVCLDTPGAAPSPPPPSLPAALPPSPPSLQTIE